VAVVGLPHEDGGEEVVAAVVLVEGVPVQPDELRAHTRQGLTPYKVPRRVVFVEDTVVMYGDLAVLTRPGADERKAEVAGTEQTLRDLGFRIACIEAPGTLDGGDVLKHDGTVWVGLGGRTNQAGIDLLAAHLAPLGASVVAVPLTKALHLKSAVTALPDGTVVGWEKVVDDPSGWDAFLGVPEEPGSHVVLLDEATVLMSSAAPRTRALYEERGLRVVAVDVTEYEKLEWCVTFLSVRPRG
jgi:dimethylargininase